MYRFLLDSINKSDEADLLEVLTPSELVELLEPTINTIGDYRDADEPNLFSETTNYGSSDGQGLLTVVLPEYPFVVDSVIEWLEAKSFDVNQLFYGALPDDTFKLSDSAPAFFLTVLFNHDTGVEFQDLENQLTQVFTDLETAVDDFDQMLETCRGLSDSLSNEPNKTGEPLSDPAVIQSFLTFLIEDNFVFQGLFSLDTEGELIEKSRRGICRDNQRIDLSTLDYQEAVQDLKDDRILRYYKSNVESHIYRRDRLDVIPVRADHDQTAATFHVFVGLLTNKVLSQPATQIPLLRQKFDAIVDRENIVEHTHNYRDLYTIYNGMPKHILLMSTIDEIIEDLMSILDVRGDRPFKLRARAIPYQDGLTLMVLMEGDRYSADIRREMETILKKSFSSRSIHYQLSLEDGPLARLHFDIETDRMNPIDSSYEELKHKLFELTKSWEDRFRDDLQSKTEGALASRYVSLFNDDYKALVEPTIASTDALNLQTLQAGDKEPPLLSLTNPSGSSLSRLAIYDFTKRSLNDMLPILNNHGLEVEQQSTFCFDRDETSLYLHLFKITNREGEQLSLGENSLLKTSLRGVMSGKYRDDALNELLHRHQLSPKLLNLFRLYKNYYHQLNPRAKLETINRTLLEYDRFAIRLAEFFEQKFQPKRETENREETVNETYQSIISDLESVQERSPYQILRWLLDFINATVRTNYYQSDYPEANFPSDRNQSDEGKSYISVKISTKHLSDIITSSSKYEIFVYSTKMEAIHLRGGDVARGGIRWSDRRDDYRTEVLELMETQNKKNALIVPVGAKGGFVLKDEHLDDELNRREHAREQYTVFMRGMLDLTDNRVDGSIEPPANVVRYDGDDPYLVVAADKGTAQFSDLANSISEKYDFWLSDAFASGGSNGYDHKELGITAKGGWECVKRHLREMGTNPKTDTFTVSGIGDMGGDVFGNGMILSDKIKLVAAFNHRHIFLDPDPDPAKSFEERQRLFNAENSGWDAYNESILSDGGGVYDRNASVIELEEPARNLLGIEKTDIGPEDLIKSILRSDVDLLWNGGIGTYIKSSQESHGAVEDPHNDAFRVDADSVQANVIGEGGNLGITQQGRVELAQNGVRLNTDFIDNSGGVDLSDHEVNLKILLEQSRRNDEISDLQDRNDWLDRYENHCLRRVLNNNYRQSGTISLEVLDSDQRIDDFRSTLNHLEKHTELDRRAERLPDEQELQDRQRTRRPMTRPEVSILLSYTKQDLYGRSLKEDWPDKSIINPFLERYLPSGLPNDLPQGLKHHPLRKEIALTSLINYAVDGVGCTFFYRLRDQLGTDLITLLKAFHMADRLGHGEQIRSEIFDKDYDIAPSDQYRAWKTVNNRLSHAVNWLVDTINESLVYHGFQESIRNMVDTHFETILSTLQPRQEEYYRTNIENWTDRGLDESTAIKLSNVSYLVPALEIIMIARDAEYSNIEELSRKYFELGRELHVDWIIRQVFERSGKSRWDELALRTLGIEVHDIQRDILERIIENGQSVDTFLNNHAATVDRLHEIQRSLVQEETPDFSAYQYMVQRMRSLI
jgi:glutamate dehydrogenase